MFLETLSILVIILGILIIISTFGIERRLIASIKEIRLKLNEVIETVNKITDEMEDNNDNI